MDMAALRDLAWRGVPAQFRRVVWPLLLGHYSSAGSAAARNRARKQQEYQRCVESHYHGYSGGDASQALLRSILVDLPRTLPHMKLLHEGQVHAALERVLFVWSVRHPASSYVQGMNDLAAALFIAFLSPHASPYDEQLPAPSDTADGSEATAGTTSRQGDCGTSLPADLDQVEADVYWCLCRLLERVADYYTPGQPGIQRQTWRVRALLKRVAGPLVEHLEEDGGPEAGGAATLSFVQQMTFRWLNCLLLRELPLAVLLRVWDTLFAEPGGLEDFVVYVCAALLYSCHDQLLAGSAQDAIILLQSLPTAEWKPSDVEQVLAQAYIWKQSFSASPF